MLSKRTNILFDEDTWEKLTKRAKTKNRSIGHFVREAVKEKLTEEEEWEQRRRAIEDIKKIRPHFKGKIDYKSLINYGRKY